MKIYLAKWILNTEDFKKLHIYDDNYLIHQKICEIFDHNNIKFEINKSSQLRSILIQSPVNYVILPKVGQFQCKEVNLDHIIPGKYIIEVNLNATKQLTIEGKKNKKRIPIIGYDNVKNWLISKENTYGIKIQDIEIGPTQHLEMYKQKIKSRITIDYHQVKISCEVINTELFQEMIFNGIGNAKSFGCSMIKFFKLK